MRPSPLGKILELLASYLWEGGALIHSLYSVETS